MLNLKKIPKKTFTYISSKFFTKYYYKTKYMRKKKRFFWERGTKPPIFFVNRAFWIHKGMHFRLKRIEYYHMATPFGSFAFTRKPFTPPIKRIKQRGRKKRIG